VRDERRRVVDEGLAGRGQEPDEAWPDVSDLITEQWPPRPPDALTRVDIPAEATERP